MSATNRGAIRNHADFYPTPLESFTPLIPYIKQTCDDQSLIWEPACGDGRLVRAMLGADLNAVGSDIREVPNHPSLLGGRDFTNGSPVTTCVTHIVTNPPFSLALPFIVHSLRHARHVFMLLRLNFLGSQKRRTFWRANEPSALFVLSERPSFTGSGTDATDYAWFYWGETHSGIFHL